MRARRNQFGLRVRRADIKSLCRPIPMCGKAAVGIFVASRNEVTRVPGAKSFLLQYALSFGPVMFAEFADDRSRDVGNSRALHTVSRFPSFGGLVLRGFRSARRGAPHTKVEMGAAVTITRRNCRRLISHVGGTEACVGVHCRGNAKLHGGMQDCHCPAKGRATDPIGGSQWHFGYNSARRLGRWGPDAPPRATDGFDRWRLFAQGVPKLRSSWGASGVQSRQFLRPL